MSRIATFPGSGAENPEPAPFSGVWDWLRQLWQREPVRLVGLTVYYLAIIAALVALYGGSQYVPAPYVYQGF
jgi:hypothetical protein